MANSEKRMNLITLCLIIFIDSLAAFISFPLLLKFIYSSHFIFLNSFISDADKNILYGLILGVTSLVGIIVAPLVSYLSDILGRKNILLLSLLLSIVTNLLMITGFIWNSLLLLFTAKAFNGIAATSQPIAEAAVIDNSNANNRSYRIGLIAFSMVCAMTLGPLLGAYLSDPKICHYFTLSTPLYISLLLSLINIVLLITVLDDKKQLIQEHKYQLLNTLQISLNNTKLLGYFVMFFLMQFSWALFYQSMPLTLMKAFNLSVDYSSTYLSVLSLCMAIGLLIINYYLLKYFSSKKVMIYAFIIAGICYATLSFMDMHIIGWIVAIILALVIGLYYPSLASLMSQQNNSGTQGWLMGCNTALMRFAWLISGIMVGFLANYSVHFHLVIEAICAITALIIGFIIEAEKDCRFMQIEG